MDEETYRQLHGSLNENLEKIMGAFRARFHAYAEVELEGAKKLRYNIDPKLPAITLCYTGGLGGGHNTDIRVLNASLRVETVRLLPKLWDACVEAEETLRVNLVEATDTAERFLREKTADTGSPSA